MSTGIAHGHTKRTESSRYVLFCELACEPASQETLIFQAAPCHLTVTHPLLYNFTWIQLQLKCRALTCWDSEVSGLIFGVSCHIVLRGIFTRVALYTVHYVHYDL